MGGRRFSSLLIVARLRKSVILPGKMERSLARDMPPVYTP